MDQTTIKKLIDELSRLAWTLPYITGVDFASSSTDLLDLARRHNIILNDIRDVICELQIQVED